MSADKPKVAAGDTVPCPYCHEPHTVESHAGIDAATGEVTKRDLLQIVACPENGSRYVVGIAGSYLQPRPEASKHYREEEEEA